MFDEFRLKEALVSYKRDFAQKLWPNEKYKWQAVKCFQLNWDVNATDFAEMLKKSLSATANLLASVNNFPARMIQKFAEIVPEEVRAMYIELFDESKDVYERINSFKLKSSILFVGTVREWCCPALSERKLYQHLLVASLSRQVLHLQAERGESGRQRIGK